MQMCNDNYLEKSHIRSVNGFEFNNSRAGMVSDVCDWFGFDRGAYSKENSVGPIFAHGGVKASTSDMNNLLKNPNVSQTINVGIEIHQLIFKGKSEI